MKKTFLFIATAFLFALSASAQNWSTYLIGLDPGHGGTDPGASGPSAPHEAELCLRCCNQIKTTITGMGGRVNMTRSSNTTVSLSYRRSLSVSWDPYIFQSVHLNAFNGSAHGTETWYYWSAGNSNRLASKVQAQLVSQFSSMAGYSTTNRGVKQNGWTVITGSSSVPASLSEGLFVDYRTEWNLINNTSNNGFKAWAMGHCMGFYDHLSLFSSSLTNPKGSTTPSVPDPTMTVSTTSYKFPDTYEPEISKYDIDVKAANLTADISYSLSNWNNFSVAEKSWNARTGGTLTVSMHCHKNQYYGDNYGELKITGAGKTVTVVLTGVTKPAPMTLSEQNVISDKRGNSESKGYDIKAVRNFAYANGKLYLVYNHSDIKVINARTFDDLGNLNKAGVEGGTLALCDVKECGGKIVACNLGKASEGKNLRLYIWDDDQSNPRVLADISDFGGADRLGDCIGFTGTLNSGKFAFANDDGTTTRIIEYTITNGVVNTTPTVKTVTTDGSTHLSTQATTRVYPDETGYWIDGKDNYLTRLDTNGQRSYYVDSDVTWGNSLSSFTFGGINYALVNNYNDMIGTSWSAQTDEEKALNFTGGHMRLLNVTDGWSKPVDKGIFPSDKLSDTRQNQYVTGGVLSSVKDGEYVEAWVLSTNQGLGYFNYVASGKSLPTYSTDPVTPAGPTLSTSASSLTMDGIAFSTSTATVKISGVNLEGDINLALSGTNASMFSLDKSSIAKADASGTVTITYAPTDEGTHTATLTASSANASDVTVKITATAKPKTYFDDNVASLTEGWVYSEIKGNAASADWVTVGATGPWTREVAYANGKLYVLNGHAWAATTITILDAKTGAKQGTLNVEGISGGQYAASSLASIGGKIILCNQARDTDNFKVYIWDDDNSAPRTLLDLAPADRESLILGKINTYGDLTNGKLLCSDETNILVFPISNGSISTTYTKVTIAKTLGTSRLGIADVTLNSDGTFWVTAKDTPPTHVAADGSIIETVNAKYANGHSNAARFITFGTKKYLAAATYLNKSNTSLAEGALAFTDITNGINAEGVEPQLYPRDNDTAVGLGTTRNIVFMQDVEYAVEDKDLHIWTVTEKQGIGYFYYKGEKDSGVKGLTADGAMKAYAVGNTLTVNGVNVQNVKIYSATGALVAAGTTNKVAIGNLAKGLYIVRVVDNNGQTHSQAFTRK
ncbi:MAG: N-acetylmuramoyl-L-alanine amidase [Candidatus Limisoma sp.]